MCAMTLMLASASPRRKQLLAQLGLSCEVKPQDIDESRRDGESPCVYVRRLALEKAQAATAERFDAPRLILAADTVVALEDQVFDKPSDEESAVAALMQLAGTTHSVRTAVCLLRQSAVGNSEEIGLSESHTRVRFSNFSEASARQYWRSGEPLGKAGGYAIQGLGASFIELIDGSYSGVMGLPLFESAELLRLAGIDVLTLAECST